MTVRVVCMVVGMTLLSLMVVAGEDTSVETYGAQLDANLEITPIETLLSDPDAWSGKHVRIAGEVTGVCTKQGCWMDLTSENDATFRVKVDDGVIVFPQEALGALAEAHGTVEILDMTREKYEAWLQHVAEEEGREFDATDIGEAPYRIVRLRGLGAEIAGP